jgi:hypothetical protein
VPVTLADTDETDNLSVFTQTGDSPWLFAGEFAHGSANVDVDGRSYVHVGEQTIRFMVSDGLDNVTAASAVAFTAHPVHISLADDQPASAEYERVPGALELSLEIFRLQGSQIWLDYRLLEGSWTRYRDSCWDGRNKISLMIFDDGKYREKGEYSIDFRGGTDSYPNDPSPIVTFHYTILNGDESFIWWIVVMTVVCVAIAAILGVGIYCCCRKCKKKAPIENEANEANEASIGSDEKE